MAQLNFDASTVQPSKALDPIPAGWYNVNITETELKPTSNGTGSFLLVEMTVLDGPHVGRKVFDRLNLQNPNPVAVEIGYETLSAICHAVNIIQVQDSSQLHGIPLEAKVAVTSASGDYGASNDVKGYRACGSGGGAGQGGMQQPAMQQPAMQQPQQPQMQPQQPVMQQPQMQPQQQQPQQPAQMQPQMQPQQPVMQPTMQPQQQQPQQPAQPQMQPQQQPMGPSAGAAPGVPPWASKV